MTGSLILVGFDGASWKGVKVDEWYFGCARGGGAKEVERVSFFVVFLLGCWGM